LQQYFVLLHVSINIPIMIKFLKVFLLAVGSLLGILIILITVLFFAVQHEGFQNRMKNIALPYLEEQLQTRIELERIAIRFPDRVVLMGLLVEDEQGDTLISMRELIVDINMRRLFNKEVVVRHIELNGVNVSVYQLPTSKYNYEFIVDALSDDQTEKPPKDSSSLNVTIDIHTISINEALLRFSNDSLPHVLLQWKALDIKLGDLDLERVNLGVDLLVLQDATAELQLLNADPLVESVFNPSNIRLSNINLQLADVLYSPDAIRAELSSMSLHERSGLSVRHLSMTLNLLPQSLEIANFYLRTPHTKLQNSTVLHFDSLAQLGADLAKVDIQTRLDDSFIGRRDVLLFMPDLTLGEGMKLPPLLKADVDFRGSIQKFRASIKLDSKLVGFRAHADMNSVDPDALDGVVVLNDFFFKSDSLSVALEEISLHAEASLKSKQLLLTLPFARVLLKGDYQLTQLGDVVSNLMVKYFNVAGASLSDEGNQEFELTVELEDHPLLRSFLPDSLFFEPLDLYLSYRSKDNYIRVDAGVASLQIGELRLNEPSFSVHTTGDTLMFAVKLEEIKQAEMEVPPFLITGKLLNDIEKLTASIILESQLLGFRAFIDMSSIDPDALDGIVVVNDLFYNSDSLSFTLDEISLHAEVFSESKQLLLSFPFAQLLLKGDYQLSQLGNVVNNLMVKYFNVTGASLSDEVHQEFELMVQLEDHPLLHHFLPDSLLFEPMDLYLSYRSHDTHINMEAGFASLQMGELKLNKPSFSLYTTGDTLSFAVKLLDVKQADLEAPAILFTGMLLKDVADFSLLLRDTLHNEDNRISGSINLSALKEQKELPPLNVDLIIDRLSLKSIEPFAADYISDTRGFFSGSISVVDLLGEMEAVGALAFNDIAMDILVLNQRFSIPDNTLQLTSESLVFRQFDFVDEKGEKLTIDGSVGFKEFKDFKFNLSVKTDNFHALNSTVGSHELIYGDLYLGLNLTIKGDLDLPVVSGSLNVKDKSRLTFIIPQTNPSLTDRTGIVEFVTAEDVVQTLVTELGDSLSTSRINGMDVGVNLLVDKNAELTVIIDKITGDYVKLKGEAMLSAGIDPSGKVSLTGRYEFHEGVYELHVSLIQRSFAIQKGSYIQWTGDPLAATMDITAVYKVSTAPLSLVESRLGGVGLDVRNRYLQRLPFETQLKVQGELTEPVIGFDIVLAENGQLVNPEVISTTKAQLTQLRTEPSELYKQVFALLLFNQFLADDPMHSSSGGSPELMVRESAGRILSQQLNRLAGDLIKGFELEVDVNAVDDYSTGVRESRTDLNVALSKQMFDDRLKITVGSSFGLEGDRQENESASSIAGNFTADYLITKDGRYKLRAYRKNQYQVALLGEIVETGLTFMITMDFDQWNELVKKP
jgi:hypothetical protein